MKVENHASVDFTKETQAQNPTRDKVRTKCPYCDKVYEWKRGLRRHLSKYHKEVKE